MDAVAILEQLQHQGVTVRAAAGNLLLEPGSKVPVELIAEVKLHKPELLAYLTRQEPPPEEVADSVDCALRAATRLGQQLQKGEIMAFRCGLTGKACWVCYGIPCLGSSPLDGDARR